MAPKSTKAVGAAILGLPAADSAVASQEHTPDSWRALLAGHPDAALGVFQLCTGGRDWVLSTAPNATVQLDCTIQHPPWQWFARLTAVADALHTRGTRPTTLKLQCDESGPCAAQASVVLGTLRGAARSVQALEVHCSNTPPTADSQPISRLLQCAAQTFSGLRRLTLRGAGAWVLPAPTLLPQLQHLSAYTEHTTPIEASQLARSIAAYVPQLSSLASHMDQSIDTFALLFPKPSQTLTHLSISHALTDDSLQLLVTQAPVLQSLSVGELQIRSDACQHMIWGVSDVKVAMSVMCSDGAPQMLARLPQCADGQVMRLHLPTGRKRLRFSVVDAEVG